MNMGAWVRDLGLETYEPAFRQRHIDFDSLKTLEAADLKELGITSPGHRKLLLDAIAAQKGRPAGVRRRAATPSPSRLKRQSSTRSNGAEARQLADVKRLFETPERTALPPLVGRDNEFSLLLRVWQRARDGAGQVVLLSGEPGIGKSRMVGDLSEQLTGEPCTPLYHECSPEHAGTPFRPLIKTLERTAVLARGQGAAERRATSPIADLLSIGPGERALQLTPQRRRQRIFEILLEHLAGLARRQTVLAVYEDLQWADPSTLELLDMMVERIQSLPVLAIMTFRPGLAAPWSARAHVTELALPRLTRRQCETLIDRLSGERPLPEPLRAQIAARAEGAPLLIEELTKAALVAAPAVDATSDGTALAPPLLPALDDALVLRLDRSSAAREVLQIAAVIGREFSHELLTAVAEWPEDQLQQALDQLVASELIFRRAAPPNVVYVFKHALIQAAAYRSAPEDMRRSVHGRAARMLEERWPDVAASEPERLAHHYACAGLAGPAVTFWLRAGRQALASAGCTEAIAHLSRGLDVLDGLPDVPEHAFDRLRLLAALAQTLSLVRGYAAPEAAQAYDLARTLCRHAGETAALLPIVRELWDYYHTHGDFETARELAEQCRKLATGAGDPGLMIEAHFCQGVTALFEGAPPQAREHLTRSIVLHDVQRDKSQDLSVVPGARVISLSHLAQASWLCGYPDQAARAGEEAVTLARATAHPFALAYALLCTSWVHQFRRDACTTRELAAAALACSSEAGLPSFLAMAQVLQGWASAQQQAHGQAAAAEKMRQAVARYQASGAEIARPYLLALLADVDGRPAADAERGLSIVAEAMEVVRASGERWYEAELCRQEGELLLRRSVANRRAASARFCQALAVAHQQGSKSLELRAAVSLARLWCDPRRRSEAYDLLAPVYGWFTEGFETADLKEAKALLEALS